jgi:hypothetical protein
MNKLRKNIIIYIINIILLITIFILIDEIYIKQKIINIKDKTISILYIKINEINKKINKINTDKIVYKNIYKNNTIKIALISWIKSRVPNLKTEKIDDILKTLNFVLENNNSNTIFKNKYEEQCFIIALMSTESSFRSNVKSNKNAIGLMQINPSNIKYLNKKCPSYLSKYNIDNLYEITHNIQASLIMIDDYIKILHNKFDNFDKLSKKKQIYLILKLYLGKNNFIYQHTIYKDYKCLYDIVNDIIVNN